MNRLLNYILGGFLVLTGAALSLTLSETSAHAVNCGAAECYADSTVRGESNWEDTASSGGSGSTGGGGGGHSSSDFVMTVRTCDSWLPVGGGQSTGTYPAENSNRYNCSFADGGAYTGSGGEIWFSCAPRSDRASNGRVTVFYQDPNTGRRTYAWYYCLYPTDAYAPIERLQGSGKIYTGGQGSFFLTGTSPNASQVRTYNGGGNLSNTSGYISRNVNLANPEAYTGAWQPSFTGRTSTKSNGDPDYGFYRLDWRLDYRICEKWAYPSWLGVPARYDCSRTGVDTSATPYTYACNFNPPLVEGVRSDGLFIPSACEPRWVCDISGDTTVGGQPDALTVMRNGEQLPVRFPSVGVSGTNVRNATDWRYFNAPLRDVSPTLNYVESSWAWSTWDSYRQDGTIAFRWASVKTGQGFEWNTRFRFTAQFYLPTQTVVGGSPTYRWVTGTAECPQTVDSPKVEVVRAVNR